MSLNRHTPIWPYLAAISCLFVICVTGPRAWKRPALEKPARTTADGQLGQTPASRAKQKTVWAVEESDDLAAIGSGDSTMEESVHSELAQTNKLSGVEQESADSGEQPAVRVRSPADRLAMRTGRPVPLSKPMGVPSSPQQPAERNAPLSEPGIEASPAWPRTLLQQLAALSDHESTAAWARQVEQKIRQLYTAALSTRTEQSIASISNALSGLETAIEGVPSLIQKLDEPERRSELRRAKYGVERRMALWKSLQSQSHSGSAQQRPPSVDPRMARHLSEIAALTGRGKQGDAWRKYLMLDALENSGDKNDDERKTLARRVLQRMASARLSRGQRRFVDEGPLAELDATLRRWTREDVKPIELASNLELFEQTPSERTAASIARQVESLLISDNSSEQQVGRHVDRHYRNANLRIALTDDLVNRWLPRQPALRAPVRDNIAGASIRGESYTTTKLGVRLMPDGARLRLRLEASGLVSTDTQANSGPATFYTEGATHYAAAKTVVIDNAGFRIHPAIANARSNSELLQVNTNFDPLPIVNTVVRELARAQHDKAQPRAHSEMDDRVISEVRSRMDRQADPQIQTAAAKFERRVLSPLVKMNLALEPLNLYTTADRLVMRLRLAGDDQLGAHTPRPRAPSDSAASAHLHESAINNAIARLEFAGATYELPELYDAIAERLEVQLEVPDDLPRGATVRFAETDPVRVRFDEGQVYVWLSIDELADGRNRFRNFVVRAVYHPEVAGLEARLVRSDPIRLKGDRLNMRAQIALRGVFSKVFSQHRPLALVDAKAAADPRLAGLEVTQLDIADGWIGLAIGPARRTAKRVSEADVN